MKRMLLEHEWRRLQAYEAYACTHFDHVVTVTEEDKYVLRGLVHSQLKQTRQLDASKTKESFTTIPICVDTQSIVPV